MISTASGTACHRGQTPCRVSHGGAPRYVLATLSNGNVALLVNLAKHGGLPWDAVLSAELAHQYKPDPEVYLTAADLLGLEPEQIMIVAAHKGDLRAAAALGVKTAYVPRPLEYGPDREIDTTPDPSFDLFETDFNDLADRLGLPESVRLTGRAK